MITVDITHKKQYLNEITTWLEDVVLFDNYEISYQLQSIIFKNDEDATAFILAFPDSRYAAADIGYFYAPYIPIMNIKDKI